MFIPATYFNYIQNPMSKEVEHNFLSEDSEPSVVDKKIKRAELDNAEVIRKLTERREEFEGKIARINATITLLRQTPNYTKIMDLVKGLM